MTWYSAVIYMWCPEFGLVMWGLVGDMWYGMLCGVVWCGVVWCVVWCDVWCGVVSYDEVWCSVLLCSMVS